MSLFADGMTLYRENLKDSTKKNIRISEFCKVIEYKINVQKYIEFLYTNNTISERETKKTIPFKITSKQKIKPTNKFNQEVKDLYI